MNQTHALPHPHNVAPAGPGPTMVDWLEIIRAEYLEMPGMHLTGRQAQRLWNLDPATCETLLAALVATGFLRRTPTGGYMRAQLDR